MLDKLVRFCICSQNSRLVLNSLFCFLFCFGKVENLMLGFGFLSNLPAFATWSDLVGTLAMLLTLNIVNR